MLPTRWTAPEILNNPTTKFSEKTDIWSYGIVLMEILIYCNEIAFNKEYSITLKENIILPWAPWVNYKDKDFFNQKCIMNWPNILKNINHYISSVCFGRPGNKLDSVCDIKDKKYMCNNILDVAIRKDCNDYHNRSHLLCLLIQSCLDINPELRTQFKKIKNVFYPQ